MNNYINLNKKFQDLVDLITLSEKESETDLLNESILELKNLNLLINSLYIETLMNGQADSKDAFWKSIQELVELNRRIGLL